MKFPVLLGFATLCLLAVAAQAVEPWNIGERVLNAPAGASSQIAGVKVHRVMPAGLKPENKNRAFVYIHGGAYVFGGSLFTNEGIDHVLVSYDGMLSAAALLYADGTDLKDPLLSPVYGDFAGFPPSYLITGTRDMFLSDTARTHRKLRTAGVVADLNVYEGISHAEYAFAQGSPEWQQAYGELAAFLQTHLK
jgi:acetyl esterase/lipase